MNIWVMDADGSNPTPLTNLTAAGCDPTEDPQWSPDGTQIIFDSARALDGSDAANTNSTSNIWIMSADGSNATPLTSLTADNSDSNMPLWSPDGTKIAYVSARALDGSNAANTNNALNIWVMDADGSNAVPLTTTTANGANSMFLRWSPDGAKIAFASSKALDGSDAANTNSNPNIWVVDADGSNAMPLTNLTTGGAVNVLPYWLPDGLQISYASARALDGSDAANTSTNIWVMNTDGSNSTPLTSLTAANAINAWPLWLPNGLSIVCPSARALDGSDAANTNNTINVWLMDADGSNATPLTSLTANDADSTDIAF